MTLTTIEKVKSLRKRYPKGNAQVYMTHLLYSKMMALAVRQDMKVTEAFECAVLEYLNNHGVETIGDDLVVHLSHDPK